MILLAPMEGVVDAVMRDVLTSIGGYDLATTEFIRVTRLLNPEHVFYRYCPELHNGGRTTSGTPVFVQLLGGDPAVMAENAARAAELGAPGIDLNFGCPAKTVNRHDGGSVILQWPERVYKITTAVRQAVNAQTPVTVKIRLGFENSDLSLDNALAAQSAGAARLTVHARTKIDGYKPPAYWEKITPIREKLKIPVVANGEIWNREDATRCQQITGCDLIMVGRGAIANPFLGLMLKSSELQASWHNVTPVLSRFFHENVRTGGNACAISRGKQWLRLLSRSYPQAKALFERIKCLDTFDHFQKELLNDAKIALPAH